MPLPQMISDDFANQPLDYWDQVCIGQGKIEPGASTIRFAVEGAEAGLLSDAEIGDYHQGMPWRPPLALQVRARFSHQAEELLGTAGFGFWNNPFRRGRVLAAPNTLWFFFASTPSQIGLVAGSPGQGWKAHSLNTGNPPSWLVIIGGLALQLPIVSKLAWNTATNQIKTGERILDIGITQWHDYWLQWLANGAVFAIDGQEVLRIPNPPRGPLGFVAWMDNQFVVLKADGRSDFGTLAIGHSQWLEIDSLKIESI